MLSIVIPVYNEAESLETLHGELAAIARSAGYELQILFVDDGSRDDSWDVIRRLASTDDRALGIRLRRNFGKAAALGAGFASARGELVFTLDADLQDDPREIPKFLERIGEGYDVVSGYKQVRHDPWHKVLPSRIFNWMVSRLTGVHLHDHNCGFKCYRLAVVREVQLYGELHRFVPVLAWARGFRIGEVVVRHRARQFGRSKYGVKRLFKGFLDLLTVKFLVGFGERPQHMLGGLGLLSFFLGTFGMTFLGAMWLISRLSAEMPDFHLHEHLAATFFSLGALLLGGQFMSIGFLAELITAYQLREGQTYAVAERTDDEADPVAQHSGGDVL
jgi:glycosyltransferase involved in cell wall biosynthesis